MPPYAPTLMESTRAIGYSIESAIADIIDNSVAAKAGRVDIDFFPIGEAYISILDDGCGMSEERLISAMQYGSKDPLDEREEYDLGRYGLGMKTASLSQCRILTVITKQNGVLSGAQWNLDHVKKAESWSLIILDDAEFNKYPSYDKLASLENGTLVIWQDLDKFAIGENDIAEAFSRKMMLIREHLSLVFHRYLSGEQGLKKLDIRMNELSIDPHDPFLSKKSTQLMDEETIVVRGSKVKVKPYILPHVSKLTQKELKALGGKEGLRKQQGFYVYRNKRLLVWGTWFRLMRQGDLSKLARVQVDIPNSLDDLWTLDIKKSIATPPEDVKQNLAVIIEKISEGSKRTWTYRGKKETRDDVIHTVKIEKDNNNDDHRIDLVYELETSMLEKVYCVGESKKYLLDEIYDRTLKMEQERRYCMKFMHPYIDIGRINVIINIYDASLQPLSPITYRLEDILYPDAPQLGHIKDIDRSIPSGEEMLHLLEDKEVR